MREGILSAPLPDRIGTRLDAAPLLVMLDVDGTLAPIAPTPEQAAIPRATVAALQRMVRLPSVTLAFISGRAAMDAWRMTRVDGAWVAGNHGGELRDPSGTITVHPDVMTFEANVAAAVKVLAKELATVGGALVEDKRWTISVHYRQVAEAEVPALVTCAERVASVHGLRLMDGKKIVELRPPVDVHKGTAVATLLQRARVSAAQGAALYAGDDRTDEDAFIALRAAIPDAVTIRVAHRSTFATAAEFELDEPDQLRVLLEWLVARRAAARLTP